MRRIARWIQSGDVVTFFWVNRTWRSGLFDAVMPLLTKLGGAVFTIGFCLALLVSRSQFWRKTGVYLAVSLLASHLVVAACKRLLGRNRPYQVLENVFTGNKLLTDASFPSGHTTAAFCTATVLSFMLPGLAPAFVSIAFLVGSSRVYLGLHYPSDVLIGAVIGVITPLAVFSFGFFT